MGGLCQATLRWSTTGSGLRGPLHPSRAISNNRLLALENGSVTFRWKDYRHSSQLKTMTLTADEFLRRFLLHVLPDGLQRIRYYGFLGNRYRAQKLTRCRQLLGMAAPPETAGAPQDYRDRYERLTGFSLRECPSCGQGRMVLVDTVEPFAPRVRVPDTS